MICSQFLFLIQPWSLPCTWAFCMIQIINLNRSWPITSKPRNFVQYPITALLSHHCFAIPSLLCHPPQGSISPPFPHTQSEHHAKPRRWAHWGAISILLGPCWGHSSTKHLGMHCNHSCFMHLVCLPATGWAASRQQPVVCAHQWQVYHSGLGMILAGKSTDWRYLLTDSIYRYSSLRLLQA